MRSNGAPELACSPPTLRPSTRCSSPSPATPVCGRAAGERIEASGEGEGEGHGLGLRSECTEAEAEAFSRLGARGSAHSNAQRAC